MDNQPSLAARVTLLQLGFRPFFLFAGLFAPIAIAVWVAIFAGALAPLGAYPPSYWHAHEMLFGFAAAAISGFLLTAVPNWTGARPVSGAPLATLALLWLAGRAAIWGSAWLPPWAVAAVDLAYFPALAVILGAALARGSARNMIFVAVLGFLFAGNLLFHLEALGIANTAARGLNFTVDLIALLITIVGGRVTPAFTRNALQARAAAEGAPAPEIASFFWLNEGAILAVAVMTVADLVAPNSRIVGLLAVFAALIGALRMAGWQGFRTRHEPLLWVLHLGYGWVVAGLAIKGAAALTGALPATVALHGITIGGIGSMTLGIMSRASLGHSGRKLHAGPGMAAAYLLVSAAAIVRLAMPIILPDQYLMSVVIAGALWIVAFTIFVALFFPILTSPRIDT